MPLDSRTCVPYLVTRCYCVYSLTTTVEILLSTLCAGLGDFFESFALNLRPCPRDYYTSNLSAPGYTSCYRCHAGEPEFERTVPAVL